jgi:KDO2-lipid IV(A) lauroyltransferase
LVLRALGAWLGFVAGSLLRIRRALVEEGLRRAALPAGAAGDVYRELGQGLVELLWIAGARGRARQDALGAVVVEPSAANALDAALASGPVVLFATHTGNWELAAAAAARVLAARGRRLSVVAKPIRSRGLDRFVTRLRSSFGIDVVPPAGALGAARRALGRGDVVAMPIDQVPERARHALSLPFLGRAALVDRAPATLAWRASATVLVVASTRRQDGRMGVEVLAVIPPAPDAAARRWIADATRTATAALDEFVRRAPSSWFWLHRRWRAPREIGSMPSARGVRFASVSPTL